MARVWSPLFYSMGVAIEKIQAFPDRVLMTLEKTILNRTLYGNFEQDFVSRDILGRRVQAGRFAATSISPGPSGDHFKRNSIRYYQMERLEMILVSLWGFGL